MGTGLQCITTPHHTRKLQAVKHAGVLTSRIQIMFHTSVSLTALQRRAVMSGRCTDVSLAQSKHPAGFSRCDVIRGQDQVQRPEQVHHCLLLMRQNFLNYFF